MTRALVEAAASSTAHGIGKAAGAKQTSLRMMWILLFLIFLALFLKSGIDRVIKLKDRRLIKEYHAEKVQFVFPDLYFCPRNSYSGSYPYVLTKQEADLINGEISRILSKLNELSSNVVAKFNYTALLMYEEMALDKLIRVQASLPFTLITNYLVQQIQQSVIRNRLFQNSNNADYQVTLKPFYLPGNLVCFKLNLTPQDKLSLTFGNSTVEIWLSTDPFVSEANFTGYPINPIDGSLGKSIPFKKWHPILNDEFMKESGYTMLLVPQDAYPSLEFETKFLLGPGNAYSLKLEMVENFFSEELHGTHCAANTPKISFENPLTRKREDFKYSRAACYLQHRLRSSIPKTGCRFSEYPMLWEHRFTPRCNNVSELTPAIYYKYRVSDMEFISASGIDEVAGTDTYCKSRIPCTYPQYSVSFSFGKWPSVSLSTAELFAEAFDSQADAKWSPALNKLVKTSQQMLNGDHSTHLEGLFRMYVSESLLKVEISAASAMSSQAVVTWSYTVTDFLADTGGLLGLYVGCSLLTLCELLELLYILVKQAFKRRSQTKDTTDEAEVAVDDKPEDVASPIDAERKF